MSRDRHGRHGRRHQGDEPAAAASAEATTPDVDVDLAGSAEAIATAPSAPAPPEASSRLTEEAVSDKLRALEREIDQDRVRDLQRLSDEARERAEELAREATSLREELKQKHEQLQRLSADFDNARKRQQRELETEKNAFKGKLFKGMVPFFDAMGRGAKAAEEGADAGQLQEGMLQLYQQLLKVLAEASVVPLESVGRPFDARFHEAMMTCPSPGAAPGTVTMELQKGWLIEDRVLRPARVGVAPQVEPPAQGGDEDEVLVQGEHEEEVSVASDDDGAPRGEGN